MLLVKRCSVLPMKTTILYPDIQEDADTSEEFSVLAIRTTILYPDIQEDADNREGMFHLTYENDNTVHRYPGGCRYPCRDVPSYL